MSDALTVRPEPVNGLIGLAHNPIRPINEKMRNYTSLDRRFQGFLSYIATAPASSRQVEGKQGGRAARPSPLLPPRRFHYHDVRKWAADTTDRKRGRA